MPLAAAVNFTILQHVGLDKNRIIASNLESASDMLQVALVGATISALATLPLSFHFKHRHMTLAISRYLAYSSLTCLLAVRISRELPAPVISLLSQLEVVLVQHGHGSGGDISLQIPCVAVHWY